MKQIAIGIVDDHPITGLGLQAELMKKSIMQVVFTLQDATKLKDQIIQHKPDILLLDVVLPGESGIGLFQRVIDFNLGVKIIAYTSLSNIGLVQLLIKSGVMGFINKSQPISEICLAIETVMKNKVYLPDEYRFLLKMVNTNPETLVLSEREIEVLKLIVAEKKSIEIANLMCVSINTIETHRKNIFRKLNVINSAGMIKAAIDQGYIK